MRSILHNKVHRAWVLLVAATIAGVAMRAERLVGPGVGLATLTILYCKGRLVILDFMELRHAPRAWRALVEGWLVAITAILLAIYATGAWTRA
jgi:hypothetical protein